MASRCRAPFYTLRCHYQLCVLWSVSASPPPPRPHRAAANGDGHTHHTATFVVHFPHTGDVCYLAYHYPYTYTQLVTDIARWEQTAALASDAVFFRTQQLTTSILGNAVPVITVTAAAAPAATAAGHSVEYRQLSDGDSSDGSSVWSAEPPGETLHPPGDDQQRNSDGEEEEAGMCSHHHHHQHHHR